MRNKRGLPHLIVYLLSSSPRNGVQLMDGVESVTRGWWRPTPGSIYPLLKEMTDQGIVKKLDDGRYELTAKGRAQLHGSLPPPLRRARTVGAVVGQMQGLVSNMEDVKRAGHESLEPHLDRLRELAKRLADLAGDDDRADRQH